MSIARRIGKIPIGLFPITDCRLSGLSHLEQVRLLTAAGARLIEIREKVETPAAIEDEVRACVRVCRKSHTVLIINDHAELAVAVDAHGVHVGQGDMPCAEARRIVGPDRLVGVSTHSRDQFAAALAEPVDYIAVGPVFGTTTKENPDPTVGLSLVEHAAQVLAGRMPLVVIGGITGANIKSVIAAAADSRTPVIPSIIAAIWRAGDPATEFARLAAMISPR